MNYEEFINYIKEHFLGEYISYVMYGMKEDSEDNERQKIIENLSQAEIFVRKVMKNNGVTLDALSIYKKGERVSPNIYLKPYYERYINGTPMDYIINWIINEYEDSRNNIDDGWNVDLKNYDSVKDRIVIRVINYEHNKEILNNLVHRKVLDLAITYRYMFNEMDGAFPSVAIDNVLFKEWDILEEELYESALKNTMEIFPYETKLLYSFVQESLEMKKNMISDELKEELGFIAHITEAPKIYILTNTVHIHGASCMFYKNVIHNFALVNDCNIYILPSSLHECMLVLDDDVNPEFLKGLLMNANRSSVGYIDLLSDNIYYFDREKDEISICEVEPEEQTA